MPGEPLKAFDFIPSAPDLTGSLTSTRCVSRRLPFLCALRSLPLTYPSTTERFILLLPTAYFARVCYFGTCGTVERELPTKGIDITSLDRRILGTATTAAAI
ncbi:hypothetical protein F53441_5511 [Fusarium austroafricanum]|uniref:Uncharacterized protein n=1 Tax=Fusarium austroafricanum TaxID=2364996 RepID=A0A8H4P851_9HYPO|nr:hypothetical protein F53441_5511 [Fusarium austroafricanum]